MPKKYIYKEDMAKGGKPKDLPVIHTQFEEEEFEYADGGMTASQEDHIRDYIVRKFDTEDFYLDVEDGNLMITATIFDEDERESFLRKLNSDLFNGMGKEGDDYVEGDLSSVDFLTEMVMKRGGKTPIPKHKKKTIAQKAAEMVGYSTWFGLDEETKAGVIADMVTEGLLPQRMAAGAKVAQKFTVIYTMLDETKQTVEYGSKQEMDEGIAAFYMDNDVADLEIKEPTKETPKKEEEKPKKKSLFDVATAAPAKTKKDSAPQVQIDGIGDEIERYDELKAIIKNAEAEQEVIGGRIREVAKDKYLEVYEKMGRRPTTIALTDDGKEILFTVQDRYKIVTPEKEEILKSYDNLLGIEVTYKFNNEVLDKENQNGEKIGDVINDLIMNSEDIPDDLKSRLLTVTRKASVKQGTIERLLDYTNPAEIFQVIEPITALK